MPEINDDFPEPDTPVMVVKQPNGIDASIFLRLLCEASKTVTHLSPGKFGSCLDWIFLFPDR